VTPALLTPADPPSRPPCARCRLRLPTRLIFLPGAGRRWLCTTCELDVVLALRETTPGWPVTGRVEVDR
jgi:hypothetical protein